MCFLYCTCPPLTHTRTHTQDPLEFQARELRKYFVVGDHVKVVAGRHEAETGLVVRIEPNLAVLLSDLTYNEVYSGV